MVNKRDKTIREIKDLLKSIKKTGIFISKAYLFGSYAQGNAHPWSDIDVALVSDDFSGVRFRDVVKIISILEGYNSFIEFHPFRKKDFNGRKDLFVKEIQTTGIRII